MRDLSPIPYASAPDCGPLCPQLLIITLVLLFCALALDSGRASAQKPDLPPLIILDSFKIESNGLFTGGSAQYPIVQPIMEALHSSTPPETIRDLIPLHYGDTIRFQDIGDVERYLRSLRIFGDVEVRAIPYPDEPPDSVPYGILLVRTRDAWTIRAVAAYTITHDQTTISGSIEEANLLGGARQLSVFGDYTTVADRGLRLGVGYVEPNLFTQQVRLGGSVLLGRSDRAFALEASRLFLTDRIRTAWSGLGVYQHFDEAHWEPRGERFAAVTTPMERIGGNAWISRSNGGVGDVFRTGLSITYDRTERDSLPGFHRALENTAGVFLGINSTRRSYRRESYADMSGDRLVQVGAAGWFAIGKIIPHSGSPDNMISIASGAEQMGFIGPLYMNGFIEAGTGIIPGERTFKYTALHLGGTSGYLLDPGALALRFDLATVWKWEAYALKPLNSGAGLRGYPIDGLYGDNRVSASFEWRQHPIVDFWLFELGLVGFADIGSVWNQGTPLSATRWHSSVGIGLRVGNKTGGNSEKSFFRLDAAWNLDTGKPQLIIGSSESFDLFGTLDYTPPKMVLP